MTRDAVAEFWQAFTPPGPPPLQAAIWREWFEAPMPDGSRLALPLRDLGDTAIAGLIGNQAAFAVMDRLVGWMAERAASFAPDVVVGLPTLGRGFAAGIARLLQHPNWVAPGTTRKLWYDPALSVPTGSVTSHAAEPQRRMWLDPRLLPRLAGRRVLLVDDVISTGRSARAGLDLLAAAGVRPVAVCVAMLQGNRWEAGWDATMPVTGAFATPLFGRVANGWTVRPETWPSPRPHWETPS